MEENLDIIEIEGNEYAICETLEVNEKLYWIISAIDEEENLNENVEVVRVEDGMIYGIDDEKEQEEVKKAIDELLSEIDNEEEKEQNSIE